MFASVAATAGLVLGGIALPAQASIPTDDLNPGEVTGVPASVPYSDEERVADWQELQFGLFLHWGVYSMFEGIYEGEVQTIGYPEQIKAWMDIPDEAYLAEAAQMTAENWDADAVCQTAADLGMKYVKITTKHHDGFAMWDTETTDYNVVEQTAFGQDPIAQLAEACNERDIELGFYFSIIDWTQHEAEPYQNRNPIPESMMPLIKDQLTELLTNYGPISELWFDMGGPTADQSERMVQWVNELQPNTVINSRVWNDKGDFEVGGDNRVHSDLRTGPWESILSIFPACWGYCSTYKADRSDSNILPKSQEAITSLVTVISGGGQFAYNIGPKGDGSFDPFDQQVLDNIGDWMDRHPSAITGAHATWFDVPDWGRVTANGSDLYLFVPSAEWEAGRVIGLSGLANGVEAVTIDGTETTLEAERAGLDLRVTLAGDAPDELMSVIKVSLDGEARIVPTETVALADGAAEITGDDVVGRLSPKGNGFTDLDGYVLNERATPVMLTLDISADEVTPEEEYRVTFGDRSVVLTGTELVEASITDLPLEAGAVGRVRIDYADPDYYADGLDLAGVTIAVTAESPSVTPADVTFTDEPGTEDDTITVPAVEGVVYLIDGEVVDAGTHPGEGTVTVTAAAADGYVLAEGAATEWSHEFSTEPGEQPTDEPTGEPTDKPTDEPTDGATEDPTGDPTQAPTAPGTGLPDTGADVGVYTALAAALLLAGAAAALVARRRRA
ncbi:alpha-L-fucosidase [Pseudactinotalea sp. HY160]|uniref:alpha-L-fucosidase n=1 Tax=Pseudactinotalea sp. HY160 TaxID=2654490 RepID=UPI001883EC97|nr:alpha-L-fucosidase [Pseudactinotalea sp. HY160]